MAIFGWCVLVLIALTVTLVGVAIICFGGEAFSPASGLEIAIISTPIFLIWCFLVSISPFTVSVA